MTGAMIAQLIIALGPPALALIEDLIKIWNKELTPDEIKGFLDKANKGYDDYIAEAKKTVGVV